MVPEVSLNYHLFRIEWLAGVDRGTRTIFHNKSVPRSPPLLVEFVWCNAIKHSEQVIDFPLVFSDCNRLRLHVLPERADQARALASRLDLLVGADPVPPDV